MTEPSYDARTPFRRERPKLETQATERLYKDAKAMRSVNVIVYSIKNRVEMIISWKFRTN
jgi:hypothetical protein